MLPQDILDIIAIFSGRFNVINTLKHQLTPQVYNAFYQKNVTLVYGQVQSGKTAMIMDLIHKSVLPCVLIIQNSLLVLKQYMQRFSSNQISFQTVNDTHLYAKVIIVMNNSSQFNKYLHLKPHKRFSLFMDESDLTRDNPLIDLATNQFHITATPFNYLPIFDRIIRINPPTNYFGLHRVQLIPKTSTELVLKDFTSNDGGILLINEFSFVSEMNEAALALSKSCNIPIIVLSTIKKSYFMGKSKTIRLNSIQEIIDSFKDKHIIIIANRMANRGLSFTSSDYTRHITHQLFGTFNNITSFLQKCRIFGVYNDSPNLKIYLPPNKIKVATSYMNKVSLNFNLYNQLPDSLYYYEN
jgi:hypothetical protein